MLAMSLLEQEPDLVRPLILSYMAGPANPELRLGYARSLISQQQSSAALDQLLKLNQDNPEFVPGWLFSGLLLTDLDQPLAAEKALLRFVSMAATSQDPELQSGLSDAYFSLSQLAQKQGQIAQAEEYLSKIPAQSEPVKVGLRRANLLAEQGKLPQARQLLENIQTSNPEQTRLFGVAGLDVFKQLASLWQLTLFGQ